MASYGCLTRACSKAINYTKYALGYKLEIPKGRHTFHYYGHNTNGLPHGKGELYLDDRKTRIFSGEFRNGNYWNGTGKLYDEDGETVLLKGDWINGKFKKLVKHNTNVRKSGEECKDGLGRVEKPDGSFFGKYIEESYKKKRGLYGCVDYMKYDFESGKYCCSKTLMSPLEFIKFIFMILESIYKTEQSSEKIQESLEFLDWYFRDSLKKIPQQFAYLRPDLQAKYEKIVRDIIEDSRKFLESSEAPLSAENANIVKMEIDEAQKKRMGPKELSAYRQARMREWEEKNPINSGAASANKND